MGTRLYFSTILIALAIIGSAFANHIYSEVEADRALEQVNGTDVDGVVARTSSRVNASGLVILGTFFGLGVIWIPFGIQKLREHRADQLEKEVEIDEKVY